MKTFLKCARVAKNLAFDHIDVPKLHMRQCVVNLLVGVCCQRAKENPKQYNLFL